MKVMPGSAPRSITETHVIVREPAVSVFVLFGVPLRRYQGTSYVWAPRWAVALVDDWISVGVEQLVGNELLKRVVAYVHRTDELDFAEACTAALRLGGVEAVASMLNERKDLVQR